MFVQDISKRLFEIFKDSSREVKEATYDDGCGNVEKWHIARIQANGAGVICWYESICLGKLPVTNLLIFLLPFTDSIVDDLSPNTRCVTDKILEIRCGPAITVHSIENNEILKDRVFVFLRGEGLPLDYALSYVVFKIAMKATELWASPETYKRTYPK